MLERTCIIFEDVSSQTGHYAIPESCTLAFLDLLPSIECLSPQKAMHLMKIKGEGELDEANMHFLKANCSTSSLFCTPRSL